MGRGDFFVSPANAAAVAMIEGWQAWPGRKLLLIGETGAGKTHLAHVWAHLSGATIIDATVLAQSDIPALARSHVAVENAEKVAGDAEGEEALFHLHNLVLAEGHSLLLTATREAHRWSLTLPDLASRMQGTPAVTLHAPDDALLAALLMKLMDDRQLTYSPRTIPFLVARIDRSFAAAREIVAQLDKAALERHAPITRSLAKKLLDNAAD